MRFSNEIASRLTGRHVRGVSELGDSNDKLILDIGSSLGFVSYLLRNTSARVTGIELDPSALSEAQRQNPIADFVQGSALDLPFPNEHFDIVTMFEVIEHVPKNTEPRVFAEIRRVLKRGGILMLSTPSSHPVSAALDPAFLFGHRHYSERGLRKLLEEAGLIVKRAFFLGGMGEMVGVLGFYLFKWVFRSEMPGKKWWDDRRDREYLGSNGFATIFVEATKP